MGVKAKVAALIPDEQVVAAVFIAEPLSTAAAAGVGGVVVAGVVSSRRQAASPGTLASRFPSSRHALAITDRRIVGFPYRNFRGLSVGGGSVTPEDVLRCEVTKENRAMRPKVVLEMVDGSTFTGRFESRRDADEFAAALEAWHRTGT